MTNSQYQSTNNVYPNIKETSSKACESEDYSENNRIIKVDLSVNLND